MRLKIKYKLLCTFYKKTKMMDIIQTTDNNSMDRKAFRSWFSIMNSIPLVARKMGEITAAAKRKSVESFSFPDAINVRPEAIVIAKTISNTRFI